MVHIVPRLQHSSSLSISKFADAKYITVFTQKEVKIFDGGTMMITSTGEPILWGWQDPESGLWCISLIPQMMNPIISKHYTGMNTKGTTQNAIKNVHELPSIKQVINYHHTVAGYPTKTMWIKAINAVFFATLPIVTEEWSTSIFWRHQWHKNATCGNKDRGCNHCKWKAIFMRHTLSTSQNRDEGKWLLQWMTYRT